MLHILGTASTGSAGRRARYFEPRHLPGLFFDFVSVSTMPSIQIAGREVLVDQADVHLLESIVWTICGKGNALYVGRVVRDKGQYLRGERLHRMIAGCPEGMVVDHVNGNGLDNRRENLRVCTQAENLRNRKRHRNNKCGFKGVYFDAVSRGKPWRAQIVIDGKKHRLGTFDSPEQAHLAYQKASAEKHGAFARPA